MEFITFKSQDGGKIGLNLESLLGYEYVENKEKDQQPTLDVYIAVMSIDGELHKRTFKGQEAKDLFSYLNGLAYDLPRSRLK
jgi:hypothetical protein